MVKQREQFGPMVKKKAIGVLAHTNTCEKRIISCISATSVGTTYFTFNEMKKTKGANSGHKASWPELEENVYRTERSGWVSIATLWTN